MSSHDKKHVISDSETDSAESAPPTPPPVPPKKRRRAVSSPAREDGEPKSRPKTPAGGAVRSLVSSNEAAWQRGMELALQLMVPLKVDHKPLTLLPDAGTLECFRKATQAWLNENKLFVGLTYTTQKSFQLAVGRLLFDFTLRAAGLHPGSWNPSGLVVWKHGCDDRLLCLHGSVMLGKEQLVEMDVNSESGQRALRETPDKTKIVTNKWGRQVVQLKNQDAMCCAYDASCSGGNFSPKSCGVFYTEGSKALQAFRQIAEFQRASYPKMSTAGEFVLLPSKCECNYGPGSVPLLGRQIPKITPYTVSATSGVDKSEVEDGKLLATLNNPSMLVFQCCNPVSRGSKAAAQKNCDMKISAVDVVSALQLAKRIWLEFAKEAAQVKFPEFKWSAEYQVQNTILPQGLTDDDDAMF